MRKYFLKRIAFQLLLTNALLVLSPCGYARDMPQASPLSNDRIPAELSKLGPGDVIEVFVWERPALSRTVAVSPNGKISYPLIGEINAVGTTLVELGRIIQTKLSEHLRNPQVTTILNQSRSYRVYVMGEVLRPGVFEQKGPVTIVQSIAAAGGFTTFASRRDIIVHNRFGRSGGHLRFDYEEFVSGNEAARDIVLIPGDTVIVR